MEAGMGKYATDTDVFGKESEVQGQFDGTVGRVLSFSKFRRNPLHLTGSPVMPECRARSQP